MSQPDVSLCDTTNANNDLAEKMFGYTSSGFFGYTKLFGGYSGGQAQYVRVPYADTTSFILPEGIPDEKLLFLADIFPTGNMGAGPVGHTISTCFYLDDSFSVFPSLFIRS